MQTFDSVLHLRICMLSFVFKTNFKLRDLRFSRLWGRSSSGCCCRVDSAADANVSETHAVSTDESTLRQHPKEHQQTLYHHQPSFHLWGPATSCGPMTTLVAPPPPSLPSPIWLETEDFERGLMDSCSWLCNFLRSPWRVVNLKT
jgi:hypothetical protein